MQRQVAIVHGQMEIYLFMRRSALVQTFYFIRWLFSWRLPDTPSRCIPADKLWTPRLKILENVFLAAGAYCKTRYMEMSNSLTDERRTS